VVDDYRNVVSVHLEMRRDSRARGVDRMRRLDLSHDMPVIKRLRASVDSRGRVALRGLAVDCGGVAGHGELVSGRGLHLGLHVALGARELLGGRCDIRPCSVTKAGSSHARRLLVEAAWHYRRHPSLSVDLRRRQAGQPPAATDAAWRAQLRLHRRWAHLDGAPAKTRTTVARELACSVWEIANQPDH
jgi:hypothetical protein